MSHYQKVKSVAKKMLPRGKALNSVVLQTLGTISDMVGSTLGPGGMPVLIERQEHGMPPLVTKDGVTVFRGLGFMDSTSQVVMEAARDAAVRTASEAGDGTTTATVLAEAIVRYSEEFCRENRKFPPQKVVRRIGSLFSEHIEPSIRRATLLVHGQPEKRNLPEWLKKHSDKLKSTLEEGSLADLHQGILWNVACISSNGDSELADAVISCFEEVGDEGNVTLMEVSGEKGYEISKIDGYPLALGYDDVCGKYAPKFITDPGLQRTVLEKPAFVIYHGQINAIQTITMLMEKIGEAWQETNFRHNIVLVATGFSESVLAQLALNFVEKTSINVMPLLAPIGPTPNYQRDVLLDLCAVTGAQLLDPISAPFDNAELDALGMNCISAEFQRFRTLITSDQEDPKAIELIQERTAELRQNLSQAASSIDATYLTERIGKLTNGIARLSIIGPSSGELRERRDRAEDAICAVRGALKKGVLLGGGWMLMRLRHELLSAYPKDLVVADILAPALLTPVQRLLSNAGHNEEEVAEIIAGLEARVDLNLPETYDAYQQKFVDGFETGLFDSTPAVLEAIRNSFSIASLLGTLGGTCVFYRDLASERKEGESARSFLRDAEFSENPADERG